MLAALPIERDVAAVATDQASKWDNAIDGNLSRRLHGSVKSGFTRHSKVSFQNIRARGWPSPIHPAKEGLNCFRFGNSYSDIAVAAAIAATERGRASAVCKAIGIANDATHAVVHFKACYLVAERLKFVRLHHCAGRLALSVDGRRDVASLAIHLRGQIGSRQAVVAAALRQSGHEYCCRSA